MRKKGKENLTKAEQYFIVLEYIVSSKSLLSPQLSLLFNTDLTNDNSELSRIIDNMKKLKFINEIPRLSGEDCAYELLPQGFSTYMTISSQKHAEKQARKATKYAIWAICISILSFIASIVFNILAL